MNKMRKSTRKKAPKSSGVSRTRKAARRSQGKKVAEIHVILKK